MLSKYILDLKCKLSYMSYTKPFSSKKILLKYAK